MNHELPLLDQISVASPCPASWEEMSGDDRVRFCSHCRLNVYNLSEMPRDEAERLVRAREGRLCVRFYRRRDGTVLSRDCPVGIAALRQRLVRGIAAIAGLIVALFSGTLLGSVFSRHKPAGYVPPAKALSLWASPWEEWEILTGDLVVMGAVEAVPQQTPPPAPPQPPSSQPSR